MSSQVKGDETRTWTGPGKIRTVVNTLTFRSDFDSGNLMKVILPAEQGGAGGIYQLWTARCESKNTPLTTAFVPLNEGYHFYVLNSTDNRTPTTSRQIPTDMDPDDEAMCGPYQCMLAVFPAQEPYAAP